MNPRARLSAARAAVRRLDPALLLLAAMVFVVQVGVAVMLPLLPLYALSLGASPFILGLLTSLFALTNAAGQLLTGVLADRLPMRRLLAAGIGSYAMANFLIAGAGSAAGLLLFRALAGVGGGVMIVGERLYLVQISERARLAFANGVLSAAGSAGSVAGPAIGGLLASLADLRLPFLLVGVTSLLATIGALFLPKPRERTTGADGETTATDEVTTKPVAADVAGPAPAATDATRAATGEATTDPPPAPASGAGHAAPHTPATSRSDWRQLGILLLAQLALMSSFGAFITTYGPFAEIRLGWLTAEVGLVFALFGLGAIIFGPWLGRQADERGRRNVAILGTLPVLAFAIVYWLEAPRVLLYGSAILAGAGVTGVQASWYALLADATDGGRRGGRFGTVAALANLGIIVGATVAAQLWERLDDVSAGFVVAGVSVALCGLAFLLLPSERQPAGRSSA